MRKLLIAMIVFLGLFFLVTRFTEMEKVAVTLHSGDWRFILLALFAELAWLWIMGRTYRSIYHLLGMRENQGHMVQLAAAANFVSVVAPTAGMSAIAMLISDARRRGHPTARVTVASAMYLLSEYLAILGAFALGFIVLVRRHTMHWPALLAAGVLFAAVIGLLVLLYLSTHSAERLGRTLSGLAQFGNRCAQPVLHRRLFSEAQAGQFAIDAAESVALLRGMPRRAMIRPLLYSLSNKGVLIGILALLFLAFDVPFSIGTLVAGFSIAYLFVVVSPTPAGVGVVEGILALSLRGLGVPLEPAAVITLAFRGVTFWEPLFIGGYLFRHVNQKESAFSEVTTQPYS